MIKIRKAEDRGPTHLGWLDSKHTFSFGNYSDPNFMGFESLRVINDDRVVAGAGFATHAHNNMEIISYVLEGSLEHKDSMGNGTVIKPGEVQLLSAGTGITHSEFNPSVESAAHFLQIWFLPEKQNIEPSYAQKEFSEDKKRGKFCLVASKTGREGSVPINQDVDMLVALIHDNEQVNYELPQNRCAWVHVAKGNVTLNNQSLNTGDGAAIINQAQLTLHTGKNAEVILFNMKPLN